MLLRKTSEMGARIIGERLLREINLLEVEKGSHKIQPSVSIGIGTRASGQKEHINDLFERADKALYLAKQSGRNCVKDLHDVMA